MPSDSLEATVAAVNTITESIANDSSIISPSELMIRNHLVSIDNTINNDLGVALDPKSNTRVPISAVISRDHIVPMDSIVSSDQIGSANVINTDMVANNNSIVPAVTVEHSVANDDRISTHHTASSELTISTEENVLNSLSSSRIGVDTVSLLQQLQSSEIVISSEHDTESIPLILDDVTLLNIELTGENMQIISLSDLDSSIVQSQVKYYQYLPSFQFRKRIK